MNSRKTRRSISVRGISHQRLKAYCDRTGQSVSGWLEVVIAREMDACGQPVEKVLKPRTHGTKHEFKPNAACPEGFTF